MTGITLVSVTVLEWYNCKTLQDKGLPVKVWFIMLLPWPFYPNQFEFKFYTPSFTCCHFHFNQQSIALLYIHPSYIQSIAVSSILLLYTLTHFYVLTMFTSLYPWMMTLIQQYSHDIAFRVWWDGDRNFQRLLLRLCIEYGHVALDLSFAPGCIDGGCPKVCHSVENGVVSTPVLSVYPLHCKYENFWGQFLGMILNGDKFPSTDQSQTESNAIVTTANMETFEDSLYRLLKMEWHFLTHIICKTNTIMIAPGLDAEGRHPQR